MEQPVAVRTETLATERHLEPGFLEEDCSAVRSTAVREQQSPCDE